MFDLNFINKYLKAINHLIEGYQIIYQNKQQSLQSKNEPSYHDYRSHKIMKIIKNDIICLNRYIQYEHFPYFEIKKNTLLVSKFIQQFATEIKGS